MKPEYFDNWAYGLSHYKIYNHSLGYVRMYSKGDIANALEQAYNKGVKHEQVKNNYAELIVLLAVYNSFHRS